MLIKRRQQFRLLALLLGVCLAACQPALDISRLADEQLHDYGGIFSGIAPSTSPQSESEVIRTVLAARQQGYRLRIRGAAHSIAGLTVPRQGSPELVLKTENLNAIESLDPDSQSITVGSGVRVEELRKHLADLNSDFFLPVYPDASGPSVGGFFLAGGVNPSSFRNGGFWNWVESVRLVDGAGQVHVILSSDPDFAYLPGSSGHLGIITRLQLKLKRKFTAFDRQNTFETNAPGIKKALNVSEQWENTAGTERVFCIFRDGILHSRVEGNISATGLPVDSLQYREDPGYIIKWFNLLPETDRMPEAFRILQELGRFLPSKKLGIFYYKIAPGQIVPHLILPDSKPRYLVGVWYSDQPVNRTIDVRVAQEFERRRKLAGMQRYYTTELLSVDNTYGDFVSHDSIVRLRKLKMKFDPHCLYTGGITIPGVCN